MPDYLPVIFISLSPCLLRHSPHVGAHSILQNPPTKPDLPSHSKMAPALPEHKYLTSWEGLPEITKKTAIRGQGRGGRDSGMWRGRQGLGVMNTTSK